jgi:hypothetical protein
VFILFLSRLSNPNPSKEREFFTWHWKINGSLSRILYPLILHGGHHEYVILPAGHCVVSYRQFEKTWFCLWDILWCVENKITYSRCLPCKIDRCGVLEIQPRFLYPVDKNTVFIVFLTWRKSYNFWICTSYLVSC